MSKIKHAVEVRIEKARTDYQWGPVWEDDHDDETPRKVQTRARTTRGKIAAATRWASTLELYPGHLRVIAMIDGVEHVVCEANDSDFDQVASLAAGEVVS